MLKYNSAYNFIRTSNPKESYKEDFEAMSEQLFENAPNVFYNEILVEKTYGGNDFKPIPMVRVDSVLSFNSSMLVNGDDFKVFIFKPNFPKPSVGMKFKWGNSYWLVINTNNEESLSVSAEVRRCNNVLRFFDNNGNKIYEPCIMDTTLRFTNNNETPVITIGNGEQKIWCQRNVITTSLKPNDRFLFGTPTQRMAFRIYAGGMKNYMNTITEDENSPALTEFYVEHYQLDNLFDDFEGGFANAYINNFYIIINNVSDKYELNVDSKLEALVYKDENIFNTDITWSSSDENVATIDDNGNLHTLSEGESIIRAEMSLNSNVYKEFYIKVENVLNSNYTMVLEPNVDYILQKNTQVISCFEYNNGIKQNTAVTILDVTTNVPKSNYSINILNNNQFSIENKKMFMEHPIMVKCSTENIDKIYSFELRGLY